MKFHSILAITLLLATLAARVAQAQELTEQQIEEFQALVTRAAEQYEAGEFVATLATLHEARAIYDHPELVYNEGRALMQLDRCEDARLAFERYIGRSDVDEDDVAAARGQLEELGTCESSWTATFYCSEPAKLEVAGRQLACDSSIELEEGSWTVTARTQDGRNRSVDFELDADQTISIELPRLVRAPRVERGPTGHAAFGWGAIGAGAVLLGTGLALDATSLRRAERLREAAAAGDGAEVDALARRARTNRALSITAYALSAVSVGAGVYLVLLERRIRFAIGGSPPGALNVRITW